MINEERNGWTIKEGCPSEIHVIHFAVFIHEVVANTLRDMTCPGFVQGRVSICSSQEGHGQNAGLI